MSQPAFSDPKKAAARSLRSRMPWIQIYETYVQNKLSKTRWIVLASVAGMKNTK